MARLDLLPPLSVPGSTRIRAGGLAPSTARPGQPFPLVSRTGFLWNETAAISVGLAGGLTTGVALGFLFCHLF